MSINQLFNSISCRVGAIPLLCFILAVWTIPGGTAIAALIELEDFSAGNAGWGDRDVDEMTVSWNNSFGNAAGSMQGTFGAQGAPSPETDAFRLTTGPFVGDLTDSGNLTPTAFIFDFYSANILPSDLIIRIGDGVNTFFRGLTSLLPAVTTWGSITASLSYAGWFGGSQVAFESALGNITFIELQITRNGEDEQTYYFDNFSYHANDANDPDPGNGGGPSVIPEPAAMQLMVFVGALLLSLRRFRSSLSLRKA